MRGGKRGRDSGRLYPVGDIDGVMVHAIVGVLNDSCGGRARVYICSRIRDSRRFTSTQLARAKRQVQLRTLPGGSVSGSVRISTCRRRDAQNS